MINWRDIQTKLKNANHYTGPIDGIRGPMTDAAIISFKRSVGLNPRPFVGPVTLEALNKMPSSPYKALLVDSDLYDLSYMQTARDMMGVHEVRNYSQLKNWFSSTVSWIDPREIPWCGAFVETILRASGETTTVKYPLRARAWEAYGKSVSPQFGAVLVFTRGNPRNGLGHVGFYWGEDKTHYHVLGGNQSNAITISRIAKNRLIAARLPKDAVSTGKIVQLASNSAVVTTNEA